MRNQLFGNRDAGQSCHVGDVSHCWIGETDPATELREAADGELEVGVVFDPFDVSLVDGDLMGEVELTTMLIVAATDSEGPLSREEIDHLLGVTPVPRQR